MRHNSYMGLVILLALSLSTGACQNAAKEEQTKKGEMDSVIKNLPGSYNATTDTWETTDSIYESHIHFEGDSLAFLTKVNPNGNNTIGVVDKSGRIRVQPIYFSSTLRPSFGFWEVQNDKQKIGLVDLQGKETVSPQYDDVFLISDYQEIDPDIIKVRKDGKEGFINRTGEVQVQLKYESLVLAAKNRIMFMESPQHWGIMDYNSNTIVAAIFTHSAIFEDGVAKLQKEDGETYLVHEDGRIEKEER